MRVTISMSLSMTNNTFVFSWNPSHRHVHPPYFPETLAAAVAESPASNGRFSATDDHESSSDPPWQPLYDLGEATLANSWSASRRSDRRPSAWLSFVVIIFPLNLCWYKTILHYIKIIKKFQILIFIHHMNLSQLTYFRAYNISIKKLKLCY